MDFFIFYYLIYYCGNTLFKTIPTIAASAMPSKVKFAIPIFTGNEAPPNPSTSITADIIRFLDFPKSTLCSTNDLAPIDAIIPKSIIEIPPTTDVGIVLITAPILGIIPRMIANTAAILTMNGS